MAAEDSSPTAVVIDRTARIVRAGPLQELSDDPIDRYSHHFIHVIERHLDAFERPVTALDLAAGTGMPSLSLLPKLPEGSRIIALSEDRAELKLFHEQVPRALAQSIYPRKEKRDHLPFAQGVFDVAWAALTREQFPTARLFFGPALRVLRKDAALLLATPLRPTFAELVTAIGPSLVGHEDDPAFAALVAAPPELLAAPSWAAELSRCGAVAVEVTEDSIETQLSPPLSRQPLFTRHLLPVWLGGNAALQEQALCLLDLTVREPIRALIHIGCIRGRRGPDPIPSAA